MIKEFKNGNIDISISPDEYTSVKNVLRVQNNLTDDNIRTAMFNYVISAMESINYTFYKLDLARHPNVKDRLIQVYTFMRDERYITISEIDLFNLAVKHVIKLKYCK